MVLTARARSAEADGGLPQEGQQEEEEGQDRQHVDNGREDHVLVRQACVRRLGQTDGSRGPCSSERAGLLRAGPRSSGGPRHESQLQ
mmetsp:Transcript_11090/g.8613  ORF Transcript_11090/g.8613 Transcript_11090/m.8613 type:complete len:87 (+) Transcript_11090:113-373(+)